MLSLLASSLQLRPRSSLLADVRTGCKICGGFGFGHKKVRVGVEDVSTNSGTGGVCIGCRCVSDRDGLAAEINQNIHQALKDYMNGFMNDPSHVGATDGSPDGRESWPGRGGEPVQAWDSPLAHRLFFEWIAGGRGNKVDADRMRSLLDRIGVQQTLCTKSVADGIIHGMDKGGEDNLVTWPEYLNSMFQVGPVSDPGQPKEDPTDALVSTSPVSTPPAGHDGTAGPTKTVFHRFANPRDVLGSGGGASGGGVVEQTSTSSTGIGIGLGLLAVVVAGVVLLWV